MDEFDGEDWGWGVGGDGFFDAGSGEWGVSEVVGWGGGRED